MEDLFKKYLKEKDVSKYEKSYAWKTAIGLQKVDGLSPSDYLIKLANDNINNELDFEEVHRLINNYYVEKNECSERTQEADKVSVRIAEILSEKSFTFSIVEYISIHKRLFDGIYESAGKLRIYNISKEEWVLDGDTVSYGNVFSLEENLKYDFNAQKEINLRNLSKDELVKIMAKFISNLWQNHIFCEGNTRTTAVFLIKYLRNLGLNITNDIFEKNAWYFRNALVRANYNNYSLQVFETTEYLEMFLKNLMFGENNLLSNRELHIKYKKEEISYSKISNKEKIINILKEEPKITLYDVSIKINKSLRTVKNIVKKLEEEEIVIREGSKKTGSWKVLK